MATDTPTLDDKTKEDIRLIVERTFHTRVKDDPENALAVAAINTLKSVIAESLSQTRQQLVDELKSAHEALKEIVNRQSRYWRYAMDEYNVTPVCELFIHTISTTELNKEDFAVWRKRFVQSAQCFIDQAHLSRKSIARLGPQFLRPGTHVVVHGFSRCVREVLMYVSKEEMQLRVTLVAQPQHTDACRRLVQILKQTSLQLEVTLECNVAHCLARCDLLLMGGEVVFGNGGVGAQSGSYQAALLAHALCKPVYIAVEAFKFYRKVPIGQTHVGHVQYSTDVLAGGVAEQDLKKVQALLPTRDYTPPELITFLATDYGLMPPSEVFDLLLKSF